MILRKPDLPTATGAVIWSRVPEFALYWNGASAVIPYVEFYLNNVMHEVRTLYGLANPKLQAELDLFIAQERNHAQYHVAFNKRLYEAGFETLKPLVETITQELKTMREKRSLAFNVAYCAGFENAATFSSKYLLEECDAEFSGADAGGANLFLWHVAEEFEHRSVCHDTLMSVSGNYFMRVAGVIYAFWHINRSFARAANIIFNVYRGAMTPAQRKASAKIVRRIRRKQFAYTLPRILSLLSPYFHPAKIKPSAKILAALDFYAAAGPIKAGFIDVYAQADQGVHPI
jgi:uncharacterized protein